MGFSDNPDEVLELALAAGHKAVELDSGDAEAQGALGTVFWSSGEIVEAISILEIAIELNPNDAHTHSTLGLVLGQAGRSEEGIEHHLIAMRLCPHAPDLFVMLWRCAHTHITARNYEEAVEWGKKSIRHSNYRMWLPFVETATALGHLERIDEARQMIERLLEVKPDTTINFIRTNFIFLDSVDQEHYLDGLRKAGLPEN